MPFIKFLHKPKNELEKGGRGTSALVTDENEPSKLCPDCQRQVTLSQVWANDSCCPSCGYPFRMNCRQRLNHITDPNSFEELDADLQATDFLNFPGYKKKLELTQNASGETEAVICGTASIYKQRCCLFVMEPYFMMGSMGLAVGEKITRLFEYASEQNLPVVGFTVSGGARMQEGIVSLMQMAKVSGAVKRHGDKGLLYIAVLTDPTTGGVTASFAMEGDVILAEPRATVGFAGARVIEQTTRKKLPQGFQTSEFLQKHGFIDAIVPRGKQRQAISRLIAMHSGGEKHV